MASSSRRQLVSSDAYPVSPTLENQISENMSLLFLLDAVDEDSAAFNLPQQEAQGLATTDLELHRMLSLRSLERHAATQARNDTCFRKIGAGACGAVFGPDGNSTVIKLAKTDDEQSLWNDYGMHKSIADEFRNWSYTEVKVPECYYFVPKDDPHYFGSPLRH